MEAAVMLGSSAVSMATPFAPSKAPNLGAIGKRRLGLESSMSGRVVAVPQRRRDVMRMCMGEVGLAGELVKMVAEMNSESEPSKLLTFPLLDLYEFICSGPLLKKIGFTEEKVAQRIDEWLALGVKLSRQLQFDEFGLSHSEKVVPKPTARKNVMIAAHGNSLRAIIKYLDFLTPQEAVVVAGLLKLDLCFQLEQANPVAKVLGLISC